MQLATISRRESMLLNHNDKWHGRLIKNLATTKCKTKNNKHTMLLNDRHVQEEQ